MHTLIALAGCTAPLVPGEAVLGVDRAATFVHGPANSRLGASVAGRGAEWLAAAPGVPATWVDGAEVDDPSVWVGWWGAQEVLVDREGAVRVDGELRWTVAGASAWAAGDDGILAVIPDGVRVVTEERTVPVGGLEAVAWGTDRILGLVCEAACEVRAWEHDGTALGRVVAAGEGGAVAEWGGVAWGGDPRWDEPEAGGTVYAEDGREIEGLPGDHLGAAIGGGYTAGTFNKWVVPARGRVVPLDGGIVFDLEVGAEIQPILVGGGDPLVVGAPYHPADGVPAGAVVVVPL